MMTLKGTWKGRATAITSEMSRATRP